MTLTLLALHRRRGRPQDRRARPDARQVPDAAARPSRPPRPRQARARSRRASSSSLSPLRPSPSADSRSRPPCSSSAAPRSSSTRRSPRRSGSASSRRRVRACSSSRRASAACPRCCRRGSSSLPSRTSTVRRSLALLGAHGALFVDAVLIGLTVRAQTSCGPSRAPSRTCARARTTRSRRTPSSAPSTRGATSPSVPSACTALPWTCRGCLSSSACAGASLSLSLSRARTSADVVRSLARQVLRDGRRLWQDHVHHRHGRLRPPRPPRILLAPEPDRAGAQVRPRAVEAGAPLSRHVTLSLEARKGH